MKLPDNPSASNGPKSQNPSKREFYRTVIQIEVLSEEPFECTDLEDIAEAIDTGPCSGAQTDVVRNEVVNGPTIARLLQGQSSDPGFFQLTDNGDDTEEQDEVSDESHMRVRLVVEADVDGCADDDLQQLFGAEKVRQCVRQAVENALQATHQDGFDHDLCEEVAIFIAAVHLLKE